MDICLTALGAHKAVKNYLEKCVPGNSVSYAKIEFRDRHGNAVEGCTIVISDVQFFPQEDME